MIKPNPALIRDCPADVRRYITELESRTELGDSHREAVINWEQTMMRLVGEDGVADVEKAINKLKAQAQQTTLDQFAMAVIRSCLQGAANQVGKGMLHEDNVVKYAVISAYDIAKAMQAESQKRQGGAV